MSAPPSPMLHPNKSVLQKLLNSNSKVAYTPDYTSAPFKHEIVNNNNHQIDDLDMTSFNRSQSVPLNQMMKSNFDFIPTLTNHSQSGADFNEFDPIPESETVSVNHIIDALDEPQEGATNIDLFANNLPGFNLLVNNNLEIPNFGHDATFTPSSRLNLGRSQSIDVVNACYDKNPSRSVPNTPLPFLQAKLHPVKNYTNHSSRSYPSTPLLVGESPFTYNGNGDCLLNGQPIRSNGATDLGGGEGGMAFLFSNIGGTDDEVEGEGDFIEPPELGGSEFAIADGGEVLMDENGILIGGEQEYNGNIN